MRCSQPRRLPGGRDTPRTRSILRCCSKRSNRLSDPETPLLRRIRAEGAPFALGQLVGRGPAEIAATGTFRTFVIVLQRGGGNAPSLPAGEALDLPHVH